MAELGDWPVSVTGSLRFGHPHGLLSLRVWLFEAIVIVERRSSELRLTFAIHVTHGALGDM